ncbi:MAG: DsrE/DsrF/DrsH-like family protein [Deltaproteobacteria bacterium]|nr:DsrE/DsrF/DrsH-like family protein [Deltaproteobacteria bacterium]
MGTAVTTPTTPFAERVAPVAEATRKVAIICSKGTLDMAYPGLILANAARMSGMDVMLFFTFWGLDIVRKDRMDHLHVSTVGNPSMHMPTMVGGLPGMEALATSMMKKEMARLEIPTVSEMVQMLSDAGAHLYACGLAMDMFKLKQEDLAPQVEGVLSAMDFFDKSEGAQIIFV